jgi:hypothetical protein
MHQHWRVVARPIFLTVVLVALLLLTLVLVLGSSWGLVFFAVVAAVGLALWSRFALLSLIRWYTDSYAVTSHRVLFRHGVINKRFVPVDLVGVANPVLERSGWDVVFRSGSINLGGGHVLRRIPRAARLAYVITELAAANQSKDAVNIGRILQGLGLGNR